LGELAKVVGVGTKIQFWSNMDFGLIWAWCNFNP